MAALPSQVCHRSEMPMRAALDDGTGRYVVHDVPMPRMFPGAALIRVRQTGICGSDLHLTTGRDGAQALPTGHEVAGEIVELPAGETRLKVGDRVALETIGAGLCCGDCFYCNDGQFKHCNNLEDDTGGGFAEYMTRRPTGLFPLDDSIDWVDAALVEPMAVSVHAIRYCRVPRDSTVAVIGSATIGLSCIAAARAAGVGKIIASARYPQQREAALAMGADEVVGSEPGELEEACLAATGGLGADVALETVGGHQADTLEQSVKCARKQGKVVHVGGIKSPQKFDLLDPLLREVDILQSNCYGTVDGRHDYEVAIDILASGEYPYREIVTHTVSLEDIQQGFDTAFDKSSGVIKVHVQQHD